MDYLLLQTLFNFLTAFPFLFCQIYYYFLSFDCPKRKGVKLILDYTTNSIFISLMVAASIAVNTGWCCQKLWHMAAYDKLVFTQFKPKLLWLAPSGLWIELFEDDRRLYTVGCRKILTTKVKFSSDPALRNEISHLHLWQLHVKSQ